MESCNQLTFDTAGNGYGTTVNGGSFGFGTVFELKRLSGGIFQEIVLYSFSGGTDGKNPYGGVIFDGNGNLFGTTVPEAMVDFVPAMVVEWFSS